MPNREKKNLTTPSILSTNVFLYFLSWWLHRETFHLSCFWFCFDFMLSHVNLFVRVPSDVCVRMWVRGCVPRLVCGGRNNLQDLLCLSTMWVWRSDSGHLSWLQMCLSTVLATLVLCFVFGARIALCIPGWPRVCCVACTGTCLLSAEMTGVSHHICTGVSLSGGSCTTHVVTHADLCRPPFQFAWEGLRASQFTVVYLSVLLLRSMHGWLLVHS